MILGPVAYWVLIAHIMDHDEGAKTLDHVALGSFSLGGIVLLLHG